MSSHPNTIIKFLLSLMIRFQSKVPVLGPSALGRLLATTRFTYDDVTRKMRSSNVSAKVAVRSWNPKFKRTGAIGFKLGMMTHFDQWGRTHPVTVVRVGNRAMHRRVSSNPSLYWV